MSTLVVNHGEKHHICRHLGHPATTPYVRADLHSSTPTHEKNTPWARRLAHQHNPHKPLSYQSQWADTTLIRGSQSNNINIRPSLHKVYARKYAFIKWMYHAKILCSKQTYSTETSEGPHNALFKRWKMGTYEMWWIVMHFHHNVLVNSTWKENSLALRYRFLNGDVYNRVRSSKNATLLWGNLAV